MSIHPFYVPSWSRQDQEITLGRSLGVDMKDKFPKGYTSGDHLGLVIAHETKHISDSVEGVRLPKKERAMNAAHFLMGRLSNVAWIDLGVYSVIALLYRRGWFQKLELEST